MNFAWISLTEYEQAAQVALGRSVYTDERRTITALHRAFPDGAVWLQADVVTKGRYRPTRTAEGNYILVWAWMRDLCRGSDEGAEHRRTRFLDYLRQYPDILNHVVAWARYFGYLTDQDGSAIRRLFHQHMVPKLERFLAIVTIATTHSVQQLTMHDLDYGRGFGQKRINYPEKVGLLQQELGSRERIVPSMETGSWRLLARDPVFSTLARSFYAHLHACHVTPTYLTTMGVILHVLLTYLQAHGLSVGPALDPPHYDAICALLRKTTTGVCSPRRHTLRVTMLRSFFDWVGQQQPNASAAFQASAGPVVAWLPWHEFRQQYAAVYGQEPSSEFRNAVLALHLAFPQSEAWLLANLDTNHGTRLQWHGVAEYLVVWAWMRRLCLGDGPTLETRRYNLLMALHQNGRSLGRFADWMAHFGLLLAEERTAISQLYRPQTARHVTSILALLTFVAMKPLRALTETDLRRGDHLGIKKYLYLKAMAEVRLALGYDAKPGKGRKTRIWDRLDQHASFGSLMRAYRTYLTRGRTSDDRLRRIGSVLSTLVAYLENQRYPDCSQFGYEHFLALTDLLARTEQGAAMASTLATRVHLLREFFVWGQGDAFFPATLEFPDQEWLRLQRQAGAERGQGNGLAFSTHTVAEELVSALCADQPASDHDQLCRWFWMIAASAPPRFSFILDLEAGEALKPLPNQPAAFGLYAKDADKAGNCYGQFPVLDPMGVEAIQALTARAQRLGLKPITNPRNGRTYVHLFGVPAWPWLMRDYWIRGYLKRLKERIPTREADGSLIRGGAHAFRHYLLTYIGYKTGSIVAAQYAAGHRTEEMTRLYFRSTLARTALLHRVHDKFEQGELTGRFYRHLVEILASDEPPVETMLRALTTDMRFELWLERHGTRLEMGYCLNEGGCVCWGYCWACHYFLMRREEAQDAFLFLARQLLHLAQMRRLSTDFRLENPIAAGQVRTITLVTQHLKNLNFTEDEIHTRVMEQLATLSAAPFQEEQR